MRNVYPCVVANMMYFLISHKITYNNILRQGTQIQLTHTIKIHLLSTYIPERELNQLIFSAKIHKS